MSPFRQAQEAHENDESARSFYEDLLLHFEHGVVISEPEAFIMGRAVQRNAPIEEIFDPTATFKNPDSWWIYLAAGKGALGIFLRHEPFPLPFFGWERNHKPRFYRREHIIKTICRKIKRDGFGNMCNSITAQLMKIAGNGVGQKTDAGTADSRTGENLNSPIVCRL